MGGKNKQRTKNNVRPSSSGRSADQLTAVSVESTTLPGLFPTLVTPTIDTHLTTELQLCFKKLNKKDPITKAKALQDLIELVPQSKVDDIVAALPTWTHYYKVLTADPDRKVRELTQCCHGAIVSTCGRRIAPHLKQLMPSWLQAQYDEHAPAMSHATASLQNTFPDNKLPEVLAFCKDEVVSHIMDILIKNGDNIYVRKSAAGAAGAVGEQAEAEAEAARARAGSGALRALRYCVLRAGAAWLAPHLDLLLDSNTFWKYAASTDVTLRASWYACVSAMLQQASSRFEPRHVSRLLRGATAARESNPRAAAQLWDAMLALMHHLPNWHEHLEKKELFCKRVLEVLESGGWGEARRLSALLLPLLAALPAQLLTDHFYNCFFDALLAGLEKKGVSNSKSEVWSWSRSIEECVRYVSVHKEQDTALIARVVRQWTTVAFTAPKLLLQPTATALGSLLRHWRNEPLLGRAAWQAVGAALAGGLPDGLTVDPVGLGRTIHQHTTLLRALRDPASPQLKSVRFDDTPPRRPVSPNPPPSKPVTTVSSFPTSPELESPPSTPEPESPWERQEYLHRLTEIIVCMCVKYLELARDGCVSDAVVTPVVPLLEEFASRELLEGMASALGMTSPVQLYLTLFNQWLASDSMRCRALVQLTFVMMRCLNEEDQDVIFNSFDSMSPLVVEWALAECTRPAPSAGPAPSAAPAPAPGLAPAARRWLAGRGAGAGVRGLAKKAIAGSSTAADLLVQCFQADSQYGAVLSPSTVEEVVQLVVRAAEGEGEGQVGAGAVRLGARLAAARAPPLALLLALVRTHLLHESGEEDDVLSDSCWNAVRDAWSRAVRLLEGERRGALYSQVASYIHHKLRFQLQVDNGDSAQPDTLNEVNIHEIEHVVSLCPYFLDYNRLNVQHLVQFTEIILNVPSHPASVESFALRHDIVEGNISCPFEDNDVSKAVINNTIDELTKIDLIKYMSKIIFKTLYLETMLVHNDVDKELYNDILKEKYFENQFCNILYDYMVVCTLHRGYDYWVHYEIIERSKSQIDSSIDKLISKASPEVRSLIANKLTEEAATKGYYWSYAWKYFNDKIQGIRDSNSEATEASEVKVSEESEVKDEKSDFSELETFADNVTGSGYFHSLQAGGAARGALAACARALLAAHGADLAAHGAHLAAHGAGPEPALLHILDIIYNCPDIMLYDAELASCPWSHVVCVAAVVDCLRHAVTSHGWTTPAHVWDTTTLATASLFQTLNKNVEHIGDTKVATLAVASARLLATVCGFVASVATGRGPAAGCPPHVARLPAEWADVFTPDIAHNLYCIITCMLERSSETAIRCCHISVVKSLRECVGWVKFPGGGGASGVSLQRAVGAASAALTAHAPRPYQLLAHSVLEELLEPCVLHDAGALSRWSEADVTRPALTLQLHLERLRGALLALDLATEHVRAGEETCSLEEGSELQSLAVGVLLLADLLYRQGRLARGDLPHHYLQLYREGEYAERLLQVALRLAAPRPAEQWFTRACAAGGVPALACRALYAGVAGGGAAPARAWRAAASPRAAAALDKLVEKYITPHLVREEFAALQKRAAEMEDTEIRVNPSTYEAWCKLTLDEKDMELHLRLSRSHPLAPPTLAAPNCPTSNTHWLMLYLTYQNGSVANAVRMWTGSVTSKVERSTQCYICYCRLHPSSGKLPAVTCHTCRNKFHNSCLRKWFSSSGKSHCPLCRTKF